MRPDSPRSKIPRSLLSQPQVNAKSRTPMHGAYRQAPGRAGSGEPPARDLPSYSGGGAATSGSAPAARVAIRSPLRLVRVAAYC